MSPYEQDRRREQAENQLLYSGFLVWFAVWIGLMIFDVAVATGWLLGWLLIIGGRGIYIAMKKLREL